MRNNEKKLKYGAKAVIWIKKLKNAAITCFKGNQQKVEEITSLLDQLESIFKPLDEEFQKLKDEKKKKTE